MRSVTGRDAHNIKGDEADAVMWMVLNSTEKEDVKKLHDEIGHSTFVALALTDDEKVQVKKVHRYFGHRSSRRIWELFSKARKLQGKKRAVLEVIDNCKFAQNLGNLHPDPLAMIVA